jgi:hypothetical protein
MKGLSSLVFGVLEKASQPLSCQEICHVLNLPKEEVKNVAATLAMYVKNRSFNIEGERLCSITQKKTKVYLLNRKKSVSGAENAQLEERVAELINNAVTEALSEYRKLVA